MEKLKTLVYNKTKVQLKFKAFHRNGSEADLKEIGVGAGHTKTIQFGNLLKEHTQEIHVLSGEQVLKVLYHHDFPNEQELLVLEMVDGHLQYAFFPWTWSNRTHPTLAVLLQNQRYTEKLKTRIDNKTELKLKFRDYYVSIMGSNKDYYGSKIIEVPASGTKTIRSGKYLKKSVMNKGLYDHYIRIMSGSHVLLVLSAQDFQNNQDKDLVLDMQDDRFGYAFIEPPKGMSWKNWVCFSTIRKSEDMEDMFA